MNHSCSHEAIGKTTFTPPVGTGDIYQRQVNCPTCGASLEVEYIKTLPMVDDIELSPRWEPRGFTVLPPGKFTKSKRVANE